MVGFEIGRTLLTLATAIAGAACAWLIAFPAPFLTGPAMAVTIVGFLGPSLKLPGMLMQVALVVLGMNIGAGVTPEVLETARRWPASFVVLGLCLVVIMLASGFWLRRVHGFDRRTSLLSATPGHLSFVLGLSADMNADIPRISLVQTIRVLALTLIVPVLVANLGGEVRESAPVPPMGIAVLVMTFALSLAAGRVLFWLRVPAALLLGAMGVSTLLHLSGAIGGAMPNWLAMPAFLVMGAMIGTRFSTVTPAMLKDCLSAGVAVTLIASIMAALAACLVGFWLGLPLGQVIVAFMPGGLEAMIAIAVLLGADPAFVAAHHVMRLFILSALVPLMVGRRRHI